MYRIRFHGRGGQGVKTASRILGTALFEEGYVVQDAPRYGAERRGAPIFAYVRASRDPIHERGVIDRPDLVVLVDDSLLGVTAAGVTGGATATSTFLIASHTHAATWAQRLNLQGPVHTVAPIDDHATGVACVGAAARLIGLSSFASVEAALREELSSLTEDKILRNLNCAKAAWENLSSFAGSVSPAPRRTSEPVAPWIVLTPDDGALASPTIRKAATSVGNKTGLWRTVEPVIRADHCHGCSWICSSFCPDNAIVVGEDRRPRLDYEHCKGCMICAAQCPHHAIELVSPEERRAMGGAS